MEFPYFKIPYHHPKPQLRGHPSIHLSIQPYTRTISLLSITKHSTREHLWANHCQFSMAECHRKFLRTDFQMEPSPRSHFSEVILTSKIIRSFSDLKKKKFKDKKNRYLLLQYLRHICETIQFSLPESG